MEIYKPRRTLVMLHFAGGNCYSFQFLKPYFEELRVVVLELPGRGKRINESLIRNKAEAVDDLLSQFLKQDIQGEFVVYGHSMGATLGLLLCEKLGAKKIYPSYFIATGSCGPGPGEKRSRHPLRGEALKNALRELGGVSELVLQEEELFAHFEPMILSDFELLEKDRQEPVSPLRVPMHAIMGSEEEDVAHMENWRRFTTMKVTTELWPGNHFFIFNHPERLAGLLKRYCNGMFVQEQREPFAYANNIKEDRQY